MNRKSKNDSLYGFMLPMVIITGTVLLIIISFVLRAVSSGRVTITNQHYQLLAKQAAESGIAMAEMCLKENGYAVSWNNGKPLMPNTNCRGDIINDSKWVYQRDNVRTSFRIDKASSDSNQASVTVRGITSVMGAGGSTAVKTFNHQMSTHIKFQLSFSDINFGNVYGVNTSLSLSTAAYFVIRTPEGRLKGVGTNRAGQTIPSADGSAPRAVLTPTDIPLPFPGAQIKDIETNFQGNGWNVVYTTTDNQVYVTGANHMGQVGNGYINKDNPLPSWPTQAKRILPTGAKVVSNIAGGAVFYTLVEKTNGQCCDLYANGEHVTYSRYRETGRLLGLGWDHRTEDYVVPTPVKLDVDRKGTGVVKIAYDHQYKTVDTTLVLLADGSVWGWGSNALGQLAQPEDGNRNLRFAGPVRLYDATYKTKKAVDIATDSMSSFIVYNDGTVEAVGSNKYAILARNDYIYDGKSHELKQVIFKPDAGKIVKVFTDSYSAFFLNDQGQLFGTGWNINGQLGIGDRVNYPYAKRFLLPDGVGVAEFAHCSPNVEDRTSEEPTYLSDAQKWSARDYRNTFVVGTDGRVYGVGSNKYGQLGIGRFDEELHATPEPMAPDVIDGVRVRAKYVKCGFGTTIVITDDSVVYTVGNNTDGQLGDGTTNNNHTPKAHPFTNISNTESIYY